MGSDDDDWFAPDDAEGVPAGLMPADGEPWKILIVDDDHQAHVVTRMVLGDLTYQGRPVTFYSGYSAGDAQVLVDQHPDAAVMLLDVVMEHDDAGLQAARHVREVAGNAALRIVLRTGQPGQMPERQVIDDYEIDDYKAKSELTADALYTSVKTALRAYRMITSLDANRRGLEKIIDASSQLMERRALDSFSQGVVLQLASLLENCRSLVLCECNGDGEDLQVLASSDEAMGLSALPATAVQEIRRAFAECTNIYGADYSVIFVRSRSRAASVIYISGHRPLNDLDRRMLEVFCDRVAAGFDNVHLYQQLLAAQKATVHALGKLAEYKDEVTGDHVRRIASLSTAVAQELRRRSLHLDELDDEYIELIGLASVLHDVGKVGIPDRILQKPGRLEDDEMIIMRTHAAKGGVILRETAAMVGGRSYLSLGAQIADGHHEKWDGSGYPNAIAGENIPLAARIVAVADVFDALIHPRPYKPAWEVARALSYLRDESGRHFDPKVVEAFFAVLESGAVDIGRPLTA